MKLTKTIKQLTGMYKTNEGNVDYSKIKKHAVFGLMSAAALTGLVGCVSSGAVPSNISPSEHGTSEYMSAVRVKCMKWAKESVGNNYSYDFRLSRDGCIADNGINFKTREYIGPEKAMQIWRNEYIKK